MLDTFYRHLFFADDTPTLDVSVLIAGLVVVVMTLNAGSRLHLSVSTLSPLLVLFTVGGALGLFWLTAVLFTLTSLLGGERDFQTLFQALLAGLWPLIFSGVALSAEHLSLALGAFLSLAVTVGTLMTVAQSLARAQSMSFGLVLVLIVVVLMLSVLAIGGLFLWPFMLLVGV